MSYLFPSRRPLAALVALLALLALPAVASAAAPPTLLKPSKNAVIGVGTRPTFTVKDTSSVARRYKVWITIASSKKVKHGELQQDPRGNVHGTFSDMKRKSGGRYSFTPILYTFPDWFLQRPGKYWWQSFHIDCSSGARNCHILSKIRSFTVR